MNTMTVNGRTIYYASFNAHAAASRWAAGMPKRGAVVHGEGGMFWTVTLADAQRMERSGYTVASW